MKTPEELIDQGNELRAAQLPEQALECYAQAFTKNRRQAAAFNNYGNVLRELGDPAGAIPFLQRAVTLHPEYVTAKFNLAVCHLLLGDYKQGWALYETRWNYEHLAGTLPNFNKPRWRGEDLKDKTILVVGEQGHGDNIQFSRFLYNLHQLGAKILLQVTTKLIPMFVNSPVIAKTGSYNDDLGEFDYWVPIMSIPGVLGLDTLGQLPKVLGYLGVAPALATQWGKTLGNKTRMRVGFSWSGRRDNWHNQHKGMPFEVMLELIQKNPQHEWFNLQGDATDEEKSQLLQAGVKLIPEVEESFEHTAALMMHLDVVLSVDTAVAHLAGSLGRPTWIMLNDYAVDWRWLLARDDCPWYPSALLFRQPKLGDWASVVKKVSRFLDLNKI